MVTAPNEASNAELTFNAVLDFATAEGDDFSVHIRPRPGTRVVRLDTPTARKLRDLVGATFDMKRVAELCKEYVSAIDSGAGQIVQDALWMAAIVLYARCFNGGVRQPLNAAVLDSIPGQSQEVHAHFLDLRDKFVGHSVSAYEQTLAYGVVSKETGVVTSTGTTHLWAKPMNRQGAETLERMAWAFYNDGMQSRALLGILISAEVDSLTPSEVERLPDLAIETPDVAKGSRRRRR